MCFFFLRLLSKRLCRIAFSHRSVKLQGGGRGGWHRHLHVPVHPIKVNFFSIRHAHDVSPNLNEVL